MMNNNVSSAIFTLEQEVLKTLLEGSITTHSDCVNLWC